MGKLGHDNDDDQDLDVNNNVDDPNDDTDASQQVQAEPEDGPIVVEAQDERLATSDEGEGDDDESHDDRSRRRESAKERRERARQAKERDKQELAILRNTVAKQDARFKEIEQTLVVNKVTDLDARLATANQEYEQFDKIFGLAITAKNGEDARQAAKLRDEAKQRAWTLYNEKQAIIQQANKPATPAEVSYKDQAINFLKDKPWYNPAKGDEDSLVVEALDRALSKQMDPNDPNYWETLNRKVKERLPHKFSRQQSVSDAQDDDDQDYAPVNTQRRKGPPTGGTNRSSGNGNRNPGQIVLPPEMVSAMKEAGHWDDPKVRQRVAKRYQDGLKNNRNG